MWKGRIDGDPLAEFVPGCLRAKPGEVKLGELRTPESFWIVVHFDLIFNYGAKLQKNFEKNE